MHHPHAIRQAGRPWLRSRRGAECQRAIASLRSCAASGTITGLVFGTTYALTGRLWPSMSAHAAFELTALAMIYWDLESAVAHLLFK